MMMACSKKSELQVPVKKVVKGLFYVDLFEEGEIEAVNSINITSPAIPWRYGNLKITQIVKDGQEVSKGDTLVMFDQSEVQKAIVEAEGGLEISLAELEKLRAQHQSEMEELKADYEVTKLSVEISKIKFESSVYESDVAKREIELNLNKAEISLDKALEQIENKGKIHKEEIKQKELDIERNRNRLKEGHETLQKMVLISPSPGIAIISHNWASEAKFQVGDQCWSGTPLILLPDLSSLKATTKINEVDISKISKDQYVEIKPDAFSDSIFTGKVISVANLAVNKDNKSKAKVFPVEILINETNKNLLPGLTVSCRLILQKIDDVLFIPIEAVQTKPDGGKYVYKKSGGGYNTVDVELGLSNSDYSIVVSGLDKDDEVALINPFPEETKDEKAGEEAAQ